MQFKSHGNAVYQADTLFNAPAVQRPDHPLRGLHGEGAARWLYDQRLHGWAVETVYAQGDLKTPRPVDFTHEEAAGVRVIVRWNYSFATSDGGLGTYPPRSKYAEFIAWLVSSIRGSKGVWGHVLGNEPNRLAERSDTNHPIMPEDVATIFNAVWRQLPKAVRVSPPAIDPTNIETADPRLYWRNLLSKLRGAEFFALHAYSYGSDQPLTAAARFQPPLNWQYYGFRMRQPLAQVIYKEYPHFRRLPLLITETNPLYLRGSRQQPGWDADAEGWIETMYRYVTWWNRQPGEQFVHAACLYRYQGDAWRIDDKPRLLDMLKRSGESAL